MTGPCCWDKEEGTCSLSKPPRAASGSARPQPSDRWPPRWAALPAKPLRWRCAHGHEFEATPNLVLFMGHWCPEELRGEWNYYEQARVNPFFAQSWDYEHEGEEPFAVKMACDDTLISPDFK